MRHLLIVAMVILTALPIACGGTDEGDEPEEEIKATMRAFIAAVNDRDFSAAYEHLSSDCQGALTPSEYESRWEILLPTGDLVVKDVQIERLEDDEALVFPDIVVVSAGQETSVTWLRWGRRCVREDGRWRFAMAMCFP